MKVKEDIKNKESMILVPFKMIMSVGKALNHPIVGKIIEDNPDCFDEGSTDCGKDWE